MTKRIKDSSPSFFETTLEYNLLIIEPKQESEMCKKIENWYEQVLQRNFSKLESQTFRKADCIMFSQEIDMLLAVSGKNTLVANKNEARYLDNLKDKLWFLLEILNQYSLEHFKISIW